MLQHALGWARAGGGGGVSSPVIFKEVFSKALGVTVLPESFPQLFGGGASHLPESLAVCPRVPIVQ